MTEAGVKIILNVAGMTCDKCVGHVKKALDATPGVLDAAVDLDSGTAEIRLGADADAAALLGAVEKAGYSATAA